MPSSPSSAPTSASTAATICGSACRTARCHPSRCIRTAEYYGKTSQHAHIVAVWIPLVDVDEGNGCLYVIPGSNRWELIGSARDDNNKMRSFEDVAARGTPIPVPMTVGDILLFSNMTFHGSKVNRSDAVRWSIDIRYARTPGTYAASEQEKAAEDYNFEYVIPF